MQADACQPQSYCIKNHKGLIHNPVCLSRLSRFFILDIPTAPLVMHGHRLPDFAQSRRLAVRANCDRVVGVVLEELEALAASGALVDVDGHITSHYYSQSPAIPAPYPKQMLALVLLSQ